MAAGILLHRPATVALNLSFGVPANPNLSPTDFDLYFDNLVYYNRRTVVVAAGNNARRNIVGPVAPPTDSILSPGRAYNVLTVGNFDDHGTPRWSDDDMNDSSSGLFDPTSRHGDREKPEIAVPGTAIKVPFASFSLGADTGTSFAAPMVTGGVALLHARNSFFTGRPEAVKAVLLASAANNLEGAPRLSDLDGAGGLALHCADNLILGTHGGYGWTLKRTSEFTSPHNVAMALPGQRWIRIALAWSTPTFTHQQFSYKDAPYSDLDLQILDPTGRVVATSASRDNTYEIVRFKTPVAGTYALRVQMIAPADSCPYGPCPPPPPTFDVPFGWAWSFQ